MFNSLVLSEMVYRKILINSLSTSRIINHNQIIFIEAEDNYSKVYLNNEIILVSRTLGSIESELNNILFFRSHRSFLINILFVKEITKDIETLIILTNGKKIPLARRKKTQFRRLFRGN